MRVYQKRNVGRYINEFLPSLAGLLAENKIICVNSVSNKSCEKIINDLRINYPRLILNYEIKEGNIFFNKEKAKD